jgi:hypothetical protein
LKHEEPLGGVIKVPTKMKFKRFRRKIMEPFSHRGTSPGHGYSASIIELPVMEIFISGRYSGQTSHAQDVL